LSVSMVISSLLMVFPFSCRKAAPCGLDGDRSCDEALPVCGRVIPNPDLSAEALAKAEGARSCTS